MLEMLIGSSVLIALLVILRLVLRGRIRARLQYALWALVALRLLVPVSLFSAPVSVAELTAPVERRIETYSLEHTVTVEYPVIMGREPDTGELVQAVVRDTVEPLDVLRRLWYGGMVLTGAWFCYVNLRMAHRLRKGRELLSVDTPVPVYVVRGIESPCLFGLIKPAIYLTEQASADGDTARQVVAHERTHLRQGDTVWALLRAVCLVIWWFDPLVWLAAALSRRDCELSCDEATVRSLGEARRYDYGRTLLGLATVKPGASTLLCSATTMTGGRSALAERIRALTKPKRSVTLGIAALVLAFIAAGCAFAGGGEETQEEEIMLTPAPTVQLEEELGTYSDELWRIYNELDAFDRAEQVELFYRDASVAEAYRDACDPSFVLDFSAIAHCTDSWTAEYDISAELAEKADVQIRITNSVGDVLTIRSDTDALYVCRADGSVDCYTGADSPFMLESLWYWAEAMTAPLAQEPLVLAPDETAALSDIIGSEDAVYWYVSDRSVAKIWVGEGTKARAAGFPDVEDGVLVPTGGGMCFVGCTDAEGHALERRMVCWE